MFCDFDIQQFIDDVLSEVNECYSEDECVLDVKKLFEIIKMRMSN